MRPSNSYLLLSVVVTDGEYEKEFEQIFENAADAENYIEDMHAKYTYATDNDLKVKSISHTRLNLKQKYELEIEFGRREAHAKEMESSRVMDRWWDI